MIHERRQAGGQTRAEARNDNFRRSGETPGRRIAGARARTARGLKPLTRLLGPAGRAGRLCVARPPRACADPNGSRWSTRPIYLCM